MYSNKIKFSWFNYLTRGGCLLVLVLLCLETNVKAQPLINIGDMTTSDTSSFLPVNTASNYSYSQQIIPSVEIGASGYITKIWFRESTSYNLLNTDNWDIYLGHKTESSFSDNLDWLPLSDLSLVFTGIIDDGYWDASDYVSATLMIPFYYDADLGNLVIAIHEKGKYAGYPNYTFNVNSATENRSLIYLESDSSSIIDPALPPPASMVMNIFNTMIIQMSVVGPCSGTIDAGEIIASSDSVCAGEGLWLSVSGGSYLSGLHGKWYKKNSVETGGLWSLITDTSYVPLFFLDSITESTEYKYVLTCTSTGLTDTSETFWVHLKPSTFCTCEPYYFSYGCLYDHNIVQFTFHGEDTSIVNNDIEGCSSSPHSYSDLRLAYTAEVVKGNVYYGSLSTMGPGDYFVIWVDWNEDGDFDEDEKVFESGVFSADTSPYPFSFSIPNTVSTGFKSMRVRLANVSTITPCDGIGYGEGHDYLLHVSAAPECVSLDIGHISSETEVCAYLPFMVSQSDYEVATGLERIWQRRNPSGIGEWETIEGEAAITYIATEGISTPTDFRLIMSCPISGESDTSNVINIGIKAPEDCYCVPLYSSTCFDDNFGIIKFQISGIGSSIHNENTELCPSEPYGYADLRSVYSVDLMPGGYYVASFEVYDTMNVAIGLWVDWNEDGFFEEDELIINFPMIPGDSGEVYFGLTVPEDVSPGVKTFRIRELETDMAINVDPCKKYYTRGETHDYSFNVLPLPLCEDVVITVDSVSAFPTYGVVGSEFFVATYGLTLGEGMEYQWQLFDWPSSNWIDIPGANNHTMNLTQLGNNDMSSF